MFNDDLEWDTSDLDHQKPFDKRECLVNVTHRLSGKSALLSIGRHLVNNAAMTYVGVIKEININV
jgi:hypothetical protein